jgi:heme/copper-type cytochrome/quinol oxidase subunit 3
METPIRPPVELAVGSDADGMADVQPLDVTGVRTVTVGTVLFLVASVALAFSREALQDAGREWWLWTCVAGFALGLFGCVYCRRRAGRHTAAG